MFRIEVRAGESHFTVLIGQMGFEVMVLEERIEQIRENRHEKIFKVWILRQ